MTETITCPSGLTGIIRGMKVKEERILADRNLARNGRQVEQLLSACWTETLHPGPYDFGDKPMDWSKALQGDRFFALMQMRILSYGPEYPFSVTCENRGCASRIEWELDLRKLPVKSLDDETLAIFLANNRFEAFLPEAKQIVYFKLLTGADERRMALFRKASSERPITTLLNVRIEDIDGIEPRDKIRFIEELSMSDVSYLLSEFDRVDCGVDTELEVECPECLSTMRVELPFERGFFLPEKKTSRQASSVSFLP